MAICDQCGNEYDKAFSVKQNGRQWTFDSFECAIQALAPVCPHCQCRVIGHGVETGPGVMYCGASCAKQENHSDVRDRAS